MSSLPEYPLLEVRNLRVSFFTPAGVIGAVQNVSFAIERGRTLALVGESGSGKSVTAHALLRLVQPPGRMLGGRILLRSRQAGDIDISHLDEKSGLLFKVRGGLISMIFQEPRTALSPVHTIGSQIDEAIRVHQDVSAAAARSLTLDILHKVGIADPAQRYRQFPHEMSGGLRQRALVAMALVCRPELLIADEPTTSLDVTMQAQVLGLIKTLQREIGCSVLLITHDFGVVAQMADDVAVMRRGEIVERGPVRAVLKNPEHPYTRGLLDALPSRRAQRAADEIRNRIKTKSAEARSTRMTLHEPHPSVAPSAAVPPCDSQAPLMAVRGLTKYFSVRDNSSSHAPAVVKAVDGVSFELASGESLGLVGESGSGKTTIARCILRALALTGGEVIFRFPDGRTIDLAAATERELRLVRRHAQMVFQDPFSSLHPRMTVREIVGEPLLLHERIRGAELDARVAEMLLRVGLEPDHRCRYPHAFSGGQRQRIAIARALILRPSLVVCDEATSALDVGVQAQVLDLLKELQRELGLTYLFIAHNLEVVRGFCDRVAVMRRGRVVELASAEEIFSAPQHPYTRLMLSSVPSSDPDAPMNLHVAEELARLDARG